MGRKAHTCVGSMRSLSCDLQKHCNYFVFMLFNHGFISCLIKLGLERFVTNIAYNTQGAAVVFNRGEAGDIWKRLKGMNFRQNTKILDKDEVKAKPITTFPFSEAIEASTGLKAIVQPMEKVKIKYLGRQKGQGTRVPGYFELRPIQPKIVVEKKALWRVMPGQEVFTKVEADNGSVNFKYAASKL